MSLWQTTKPIFGDEVVLRSIDWLENFTWRNESTIKKEKDKYRISLQAKDFSPQQITVKTVDGFIIVEGKHEEKRDEDGYISRHFVRRYALPEGCPPESVESSLSSDGILTITAPRKPVARRGTVIPVSHEVSNVISKL
ncbi:protein lethal(2)essential for life-like [Pararge aegeria]|uniref:protein lethal(2)essential for life-like n=1 Tax=Pararge aegeria TaxID=116150 RepID=UPI0019D0DCA1|nr:protein lethal(2)essential for life-like [Pararge aegeria]